MISHEESEPPGVKHVYLIKQKLSLTINKPKSQFQFQQTCLQNFLTFYQDHI